MKTYEFRNHSPVEESLSSPAKLFHTQLWQFPAQATVESDSTGQGKWKRSCLTNSDATKAVSLLLLNLH